MRRLLSQIHDRGEGRCDDNLLNRRGALLDGLQDTDSAVDS